MIKYAREQFEQHKVVKDDGLKAYHYSLQWDCVLVDITRAAIHPHQGVVFALHCPAYSPKSWGDSHVFRSRYSVIVGKTPFLSHGHCL